MTTTHVAVTVEEGESIFAAEIEPLYRSFEFGTANVTLPIVNFDALTNGGWSINIGYHGNDFSRGTTVQVLPFIGSGGVRFGRLDWEWCEGGYRAEQNERVLRGGSWAYLGPAGQLSSRRLRIPPEGSRDDISFRVVLAPANPTP